MSDLSSKQIEKIVEKVIQTQKAEKKLNKSLAAPQVKQWDEMLNEHYPNGISAEEWSKEIIRRNSELDLRKSSPGADPNPSNIGNVTSTFQNFQEFLDLTSGDPGALTALIRQNLDSVMTDTLVGEKQLALLNSIKREPTPSLFSEKAYFNQRGVGFGRGYGSFVEGKTPKLGGHDRITRRSYLLKQMGVRGSVTSMAQNTDMIQNALNFEVRNRMLELLKQLNWQVMFGDSRFNGGLESDGFLSIMSDPNRGLPEHVIDLKGSPILIEHYYYAAELLARDGNVTDLSGTFNCVQPYNVSLRVSSQMIDIKKRSAFETMLGRKMNEDELAPGIVTNMGFLPFLNTPTFEGVEKNRPVKQGEQAAQAPKIHAVMSSDDVHLTPMAAGTGEITADMPSTNTAYAYWISASNAYGESLPIRAEETGFTSFTTPDNQKIEIRFPKPFGLTDIISWKIYRAEVPVESPFSATEETAAGDLVKEMQDEAKLIATLPYDPLSTADIVYEDKNQVIPGTEYVLIKSINPNDVNIGQLLPVVMRKIHDPSQATSEVFALFLICALRIWAPERVIIFKNVRGQNFDQYKGIIPFAYRNIPEGGTVPGPAVEIEI